MSNPLLPMVIVYDAYAIYQNIKPCYEGSRFKVALSDLVWLLTGVVEQLLNTSNGVSDDTVQLLMDGGAFYHDHNVSSCDDLTTLYSFYVGLMYAMEEFIINTQDPIGNVYDDLSRRFPIEHYLLVDPMLSACTQHKLVLRIKEAL